MWSLELVRDTDAPMDAVARVIADGAAFRRWHPRLDAVVVRVDVRGPERFEASYDTRPFPGVEEQGRFVLRPRDGRTRLVHQVRFKGWPVLFLMGWWRLRSCRMWERLVEQL